jgi:Spy/CpxP family protein refolding chaperone
MTMKMLRKVGMRAATIALCSGALCAIPMLAQDPTPAAPQGQMGGRGRGMEGRQLEMLTQKLNLTADQQTQVKAIDEDTGKQMMAVRNDTSLDQDAKRTKMMGIRKSSSDKIRAVLTDDQKTKYDALQAEMREKMKERQQGGAPPPPPQ